METLNSLCSLCCRTQEGSGEFLNVSRCDSSERSSIFSANTWFECGRFHGMATSKRTNTAKTAKSNQHDMSASRFKVSSLMLRGDYRRTSPIIENCGIGGRR
jgi:hypothetical protein